MLGRCGNQECAYKGIGVGVTAQGECGSCDCGRDQAPSQGARNRKAETWDFVVRVLALSIVLVTPEFASTLWP